VSRFITIAVAAVAAIGNAVEPPNEVNAADTVLMEGVQLQFHEDGPTFGEARPPSFRVYAARGAWAESSRQWTLEEADAVIHREGEDDLLLKAARGFCDLDRRIAVLSDGVQATTGDVEVDVHDLHYDDESGIARSDTQTQLTAGPNAMNGNSLVIDTRADRVELTDGSGRIQMASEPQSTEVALESGADASSRYESLDLEFDGVMRFNLETAQLDEVTQDVVLKMLGVDPADNLTIKAQKITFLYQATADTKPSKILFTGGVEFEHAAGKGRADEVEVDLATGDVQFRGNAELSGDRFEGARADLITVNLYTKVATLGPGGRIERVKMKNDAADPGQAPAQPRS
jgi:lipopolysaccharide export system protein LptA